MNPLVYDWTKEDAQTIKTCAATDEGRRALSLIVQQLCGLTADSFSRDPAEMAFIAGRRWVAIQINNAVSLPIDKLIKEPDEPRSNRPISATERAARVARGEPAVPGR